MYISVFEFNAKQYNDENINNVKASLGYDMDGYFYYVNTQELPTLNKITNSTSEYHEIYQQDLTVMNDLHTSNLLIQFIPLTYTMKVAPKSEYVYYHVEIIKGTKKLEFTNMNQKMKPTKTLLQFFRDYFWPHR